MLICNETQEIAFINRNGIFRVDSDSVVWAGEGIKPTFLCSPTATWKLVKYVVSVFISLLIIVTNGGHIYAILFRSSTQHVALN
jgi:hypothetical protein